MGPMLCILFLGARMRAVQMDPINAAPQKWAQNCFNMVNTMLAILVPLAIKEKAKCDTQEFGDV